MNVVHFASVVRILAMCTVIFKATSDLRSRNQLKWTCHQAYCFYQNSAIGSWVFASFGQFLDFQKKLILTFYFAIFKITFREDQNFRVPYSLILTDVTTYLMQKSYYHRSLYSLLLCCHYLIFYSYIHWKLQKIIL